MLRRQARGVTLIEAMMVLVIMAILAGLAAPSMRDLIVAQGPKNAASDLFGSLILARSEAIKRNQSVELYASDDMDWALGWVVRVPSASNLVIRTQDEHPNVRISPGGTPVAKVIYGGNGRLTTGSTATNFKITVPGNTGVRMRCVSVDTSGRPNVRVDRDNDQTACN